VQDEALVTVDIDSPEVEERRRFAHAEEKTIVDKA
jgi:hypothetical protein